MLKTYSTYRELVTVPPELNISQNAFDRISDIANDTTEHFDNFDEFERYVERDIDQLEDDDSNIDSIVDVNQIQSKNDALLQSIESNLLGLFKTYAFGIATMISSRQSTQVQNIQYFGLGNPKPDWLVEYMKALRRSLLNINSATSIATDILRQISIFDFLQTQNNELIKLLSPAMTPQSLKDYSVAKAILDHWTQYFNSKIFLSEANRYEIVSSEPEYIQILSEAESKQYIHGVDLSNRIIIDAKKGTLI